MAWLGTVMPTRCATPWPTRCSARSDWATWAVISPTAIRVWAEADSVDLLTQVVAMATEEGFACVNADCTVVAEAPRLAPHTDAMAARLSTVLRAPVSVKATRAEGLGALGRAEGIACLAIVLLEES